MLYLVERVIKLINRRTENMHSNTLTPIKKKKIKKNWEIKLFSVVPVAELKAMSTKWNTSSV